MVLISQETTDTLQMLSGSIVVLLSYNHLDLHQLHPKRQILPVRTIADALTMITRPLLPLPERRVPPIVVRHLLAAAFGLPGLRHVAQYVDRIPTLVLPPERDLPLGPVGRVLAQGNLLITQLVYRLAHHHPHDLEAALDLLLVVVLAEIQIDTVVDHILLDVALRILVVHLYPLAVGQIP